MLIPKVQEANTIKQFMHVSLINCNFEILTKLLANRLANLMDFLILKIRLFLII